MPNIG